MNGEGVHAAELTAPVAAGVVVAFAVLAQKDQDAVSDCAGHCRIGAEFVPGIPKVQLNPEVVFLVVLPPLLYNGALEDVVADFREICEHFYAGGGLVAFTRLVWRLLRRGCLRGSTGG